MTQAMIALTQEKREELVSRLKIYIRTTETAVKARLATEEDLFNLEVRKVALALLTAGPLAYLNKGDVDNNENLLLAKRYRSLACTLAVFTAPPVPEIKRPDLLDIPDGLDLASAMAAINWYEMETKRLNGLGE